jgi:hypothetical protein
VASGASAGGALSWARAAWLWLAIRSRSPSVRAWSRRFVRVVVLVI